MDEAAPRAGVVDLTPRAAVTLEDAEAVRRLRNTGRIWFGDDREISREEQIEWWTTRVCSKGFDCVLVGDPPIGYGMLQRRADGLRWASLAVEPSARGRGAGTEIYRAMLRIAAVGELVYAGIRRDNAPSLAAARRAGYELDGDVRAPVSDPELWVVLRGRGTTR